MMYGFISLDHMESLKVGDTLVSFTACEKTEGPTREIEGEDWFEPGHNPIARTYAEGAKELFRLRDRYLSDFPGLRMSLDRKAGMGGLFLPCGNGRTVILGFTASVLNAEHYAKLQRMIQAFKDQTGWRDA